MAAVTIARFFHSLFLSAIDTVTKVCKNLANFLRSLPVETTAYCIWKIEVVTPTTLVIRPMIWLFAPRCVRTKTFRLVQVFFRHVRAVRTFFWTFTAKDAKNEIWLTFLSLWRHLVWRDGVPFEVKRKSEGLMRSYSLLIPGHLSACKLAHLWEISIVHARETLMFFQKQARSLCMHEQVKSVVVKMPK